jgi:Flp pilus assembly CpaF family ATPase
LDFSNPSVKTVLKNKYFYCRFAIDVEPIQVYKFALDIRKLNKNVLTIQDLIKNETLDSKLAAFIYFLILKRINITVTGETDTGKTTLINALDLITPKEFRKIYIENVMESLNQVEFQKHQLKYQVDPLQDDFTTYPSKNNQIKNLLHRSPDLIYLGEILTKEEAEAMFHCLSAGLKGFQTIHANNVNSLFNRFLFHFKIDISCLKDLGIIIFMKKIKNRRYVASISEINPKENDIYKINKQFFKFNSKVRKWMKIENLFNLEVIKQIREYEYLDQNDFIRVITLYTEIFKILQKLEKIENAELVSFFDQLSYYSYKGYQEIFTFWENWKNSRGLNS